jgi:hypothetical protein
MAEDYAVIDAWAQPALGRARQDLPPQETVALMDEAEVGRLMLCAWCRPGRWPTNFPQLRLDKCMEQVRKMKLEPAIERKFLSENARKVFELP